MRKDLANYLKDSVILSGCKLGEEEINRLAYQVEKGFLNEYLSGLVGDIEEVMGISPALEWRDILAAGAEIIVRALNADSASIRLYDPDTGDMVSFGAYEIPEDIRMKTIPMDDSVAGIVVRTGKSYLVPNISKEPRYHNKDISLQLGLNSLIAVPLRIPKFFETETEILGTLQIYYKTNDRVFDPLEVTYAEVLARRISYVVARKRIIDLYQMNLYKEKLVEQIFLKLSNREGIKMKELFRHMVPELVGILPIHSCALFSVSKDGSTAWLETRYPENGGKGESGHSFGIHDHPYMEALVKGDWKMVDTDNERIDPLYVLIKNPKESCLSNEALAAYMSENRLNSAIVIPLQAGGTLRYFMTFYTAEMRQAFTAREIELLTFFGKEIMKALRMERLDDILHDLKNPAIAMGGFARRAMRLLTGDNPEAKIDKIAQAIEIIIEETDRIQSLATSSAIEGRERSVNVGETLRKRFSINVEAVRRRGRRDIRLEAGEIGDGIIVHCVPFDIERSIDNLLANATDAVPGDGGVVTVSCKRSGGEAVLEVRNTGHIDEAQIAAIMSGDVAGRGLSIVLRFARSAGGKLDVRRDGESTVMTMTLPVYSP